MKRQMFLPEAKHKDEWPKTVPILESKPIITGFGVQTTPSNRAIQISKYPKKDTADQYTPGKRFVIADFQHKAAGHYADADEEEIVNQKLKPEQDGKDQRDTRNNGPKHSHDDVSFCSARKSVIFVINRHWVIGRHLNA